MFPQLRSCESSACAKEKANLDETIRGWQNDAARWSWLVRSISQPKYRAKGKRTHGMKEMVMAKIIEFYVPQNFKNSRKWVPEPQLAKVLEFPQPTVKSA